MRPPILCCLSHRVSCLSACGGDHMPNQDRPCVTGNGRRFRVSGQGGALQSAISAVTWSGFLNIRIYTLVPTEKMGSRLDDFAATTTTTERHNDHIRFAQTRSQHHQDSSRCWEPTMLHGYFPLVPVHSFHVSCQSVSLSLSSRVPFCGISSLEHLHPVVQ